MAGSPRPADAYALLAAHLPHFQAAVTQFARIWQHACSIDPAAAVAFGDSYDTRLANFEDVAAAIAALRLETTLDSAGTEIAASAPVRPTATDDDAFPGVEHLNVRATIMRSAGRDGAPVVSIDTDVDDSNALTRRRGPLIRVLLNGAPVYVAVELEPEPRQGR